MTTNQSWTWNLRSQQVSHECTLLHLSITSFLLSVPELTTLSSERPGYDTDMAASILFLAGPGGLFYNEQILIPDGGNAYSKTNLLLLMLTHFRCYACQSCVNMMAEYICPGMLDPCAGATKNVRTGIGRGICKSSSIADI